MDITKNCTSCSTREDSFFCHLAPAALADLSAIRQSCVCPEGATLFTEGQPPRGVFLLCSGRAKLMTTSSAGRTLILRVAGPGDVLGLSALMSNASSDATAQALELTQFAFMARNDFLCFVQRHAGVAIRVAEHLSAELRCANRQVARIALGPSARAKLAALLLDWAPEPDVPAATIRFPLRLTHEEIGELIGCSRETVARLLTEFRRQELIRAKGRFVTIPDRLQLEALLV